MKKGNGSKPKNSTDGSDLNFEAQLWAAADKLRGHMDASEYKQESNYITWKPARMNLTIRGIDANLGPRNADGFRQDLHPDPKVDFNVANPPFNMSDWGGENLRQDVLKVGLFATSATSMKSSVSSAVKAKFNRCSMRHEKLQLSIHYGFYSPRFHA